MDMSSAELAHNNLANLGCGWSSVRGQYSRCRLTPSLVCGAGVDKPTTIASPWEDYRAAGMAEYHPHASGQTLPDFTASGRNEFDFAAATGMPDKFKHCGNDPDTAGLDCSASGGVDDSCWHGVRLNKVFPETNGAASLPLPYYIPQRVTSVAEDAGYDDSTAATFYWKEEDCNDVAAVGETCILATNIDVTLVALSDYAWVVPNWNGAAFDGNGPTFLNINLDGPSRQGVVVESAGAVPTNYAPPNGDASTVGTWFRLTYVLHGTWIKFELDFSQLAFYDFDSNGYSSWMGGVGGNEILCMANDDVQADQYEYGIQIDKYSGNLCAGTNNVPASVAATSRTMFYGQQQGIGGDNPRDADSSRCRLDDFYGYWRLVAWAPCRDQPNFPNCDDGHFVQGVDGADTGCGAAMDECYYAHPNTAAGDSGGGGVVFPIDDFSQYTWYKDGHNGLGGAGQAPWSEYWDPTKTKESNVMFDFNWDACGGTCNAAQHMENYDEGKPGRQEMRPVPYCNWEASTAEWNRRPKNIIGEREVLTYHVAKGSFDFFLGSWGNQNQGRNFLIGFTAVSYTHLRAHETR